VIVQVITADLGWVAQLSDGTRIQVVLWALDEEGPPVYRDKQRIVRGMCVDPSPPPADATPDPYYPLKFCDEAYPNFVSYLWTGIVPRQFPSESVNNKQ
jgi:hypothetical protein